MEACICTTYMKTELLPAHIVRATVIVIANTEINEHNTHLRNTYARLPKNQIYRTFQCNDYLSYKRICNVRKSIIFKSDGVVVGVIPA